MAPKSETTATAVSVGSLKIPPGKLKQLESGVATVREHYGQTMLAWGKLTRDQRRELLAHSPVLAKLLEGVV